MSIWGQREQQLQVEVTPTQLRDKGMTLEQVIKTTGNAVWVSPLSFLEASTPGTGGFVESPSQRLGIQHVLPIPTPADLAKVSVEEAGSAAAPGDMAQVKEDHQPLIGDAVVGQDPGLLLVIEKFPGTSALQVTKDIEAALKDWNPAWPGSRWTPPSSGRHPSSRTRWTARPGPADQPADRGRAFWLLFRSWRVAVIALVAIDRCRRRRRWSSMRGATLNITVLAGMVLADLRHRGRHRRGHPGPAARGPCRSPEAGPADRSGPGMVRLVRERPHPAVPRVC